MFSYDATLINDGGLNQMRFTLGDCLVEEPEHTAYLSDEEIIAALEGVSFKRAALRLIESLIARFSYEVDTKVKDCEWKLSERISAWQKLRDRLKADVDTEELAGNSFGMTAKKSPPPYFWRGMHDCRPLC